MGPKSNHAGQASKRNPTAADKESEEYKKKRQRNNVSVRKSRQKSKSKAVSTVDKIEQLKAENVDLESKVVILQKELSFLKDLFMSSAAQTIDERNVPNIQLNVEIESRNENVKEENLAPVAVVNNPVVNEKAMRNDHEYFAHPKS